MTEIESVQFSCASCGKRLRARADQGGRVYACPGCGGPVPVPRIVTDQAQPEAPPAEEPQPTVGLFSRLPSSIGELMIYLVIAWSIVAFVSLVMMFFGAIAFYVGIVMFFLASLVAAQQVWQLLRAPQNVLAVKEVSLFWGTVRLVAWEPTEGILLLRNKAITFRDDDLSDGKGGVKFIYPFLGEEVALRVPLETQTLEFADSNVLTREYLHLSIRGSMKWRIENIEKFYLLVSREVRATEDAAKGPPDRRVQLPRDAHGTTDKLVSAAIGWLRTIAEEQTRMVVSRVRSGLLIADKVAAEVPAMRQNEGESPADFGGATEGLAGAIHDAISDRLKPYGIAVAEVSLQEIRMPEEIVRQCVEAAKNAYLPLMAKRQASVRHEQLKAEADVMGKEAVGAREVIAAAPAYALRDFLSEFVAKQTPTVSQPGIVATIDVAKLSAIEEPNAKPQISGPPSE